MPGPALEIEGIPKSVPLATAVNLLRTLNRAHGAGKIALKQGDTISPTGKWALHVFRMPAEAATPNGRIVLSFYKDRVAYAPLVTDPGLVTVETAPQDNADGFAAKALASLRKTKDNVQAKRAAKPQAEVAPKAPAPSPIAELAPTPVPAPAPAPKPAAKITPVVGGIDLTPVSTNAAPEPADPNRSLGAQDDTPAPQGAAPQGKVSLLG